MMPPTQETKHVACARCRDRKVKCDGGRPSCRRCQKNRARCQYIKGRKQQAKNEWIHLLRTFSFQPGKAHVTRNPAPRSSQPSYSQPTSICHAGCSTPSRLFAEGAAATLNNSSIADASNSFSSYGSTADEWNTACTAPTTDTDLLNPRLFTFNSMPTLCNTNYTSELLTTNGQVPIQMGISPLRPNTPVSQTSDATSSPYDAFQDQSYSYNDEFWNTESSSDALYWGREASSYPHRSQYSCYASTP
ncbi:hypothetical protein BU26DRAFT_1351 [Trematosphaeria pertusa]|uniref:Zn(2)-C6 fungal-type domain-containing protein n=1 Tax=Trematosphaeria pertusa TaxID=390896 RepID=A0A6A6J0X6_9PLEO|nr:uncharacterized protein BU26DRAFT_1351 [Trematosphaeria pertusa]KAF2255520.1 hypothetical protein BU26DRAFT_1351 [Trematosphaeria pertusa]